MIPVFTLAAILSAAAGFKSLGYGYTDTAPNGSFYDTFTATTYDIVDTGWKTVKQAAASFQDAVEDAAIKAINAFSNLLDHLTDTAVPLAVAAVGAALTYLVVGGDAIATAFDEFRKYLRVLYRIPILIYLLPTRNLELTPTAVMARLASFALFYKPGAITAG